MGRGSYRTHHESLVVRVHTYQPVEPIRAVMVIVDDATNRTDGPTVVELTVVACVVRVTNNYQIAVAETQSPPAAGPTHRDMIRAGYRFNYQFEDHDVLVWHEEYGCPARLKSDEFEGENFGYVVGPKARSESWWAEQIARVANELKPRSELFGKTLDQLACRPAESPPAAAPRA